MATPNKKSPAEKQYKTGSAPVVVKKTPGKSMGAVKTKPTHPGTKPRPTK